MGGGEHEAGTPRFDTVEARRKFYEGLGQREQSRVKPQGKRTAAKRRAGDVARIQASRQPAGPHRAGTPSQDTQDTVPQGRVRLARNRKNTARSPSRKTAGEHFTEAGRKLKGAAKRYGKWWKGGMRSALAPTEIDRKIDRVSTKLLKGAGKAAEGLGAVDAAKGVGAAVQGGVKKWKKNVAGLKPVAHGETSPRRVGSRGTR